MISPGALDMGGLLILPRQIDFERMNADLLKEVMKEIVLAPTEMEKVCEKIKNTKV